MVLGLVFTDERSKTRTRRPGSAGTAGALAPVTGELVTLCEIYVWNSREGLGCTIPQKCCDINPLQY